MRISIKEINRYNIAGLVLCLHLAFTQDGQKSIYTQSLPQDSNNDIITALPNNIPTKKKNIEFIYDFDYGFFADNLEDSQDYWATRTLFAQSLAPRVGISFFNQNILVGGYFIINMGEKYPINANSGIGGYGLSLHYDVAYNNFKAYFGIFSRKYWLGDYPKLYYRDDFMFFNPMTNGMLFQYAKANLLFSEQNYIEPIGISQKRNIDNVTEFRNIRPDYTETMNTLQILVNKYPDNPFVWYLLGNVHLQMQEFNKAIDDYTLAIRYENSLAEAYYNRALTLLYIGEKNLAADDLSKAGELGIKEAYVVIKRFF